LSIQQFSIGVVERTHRRKGICAPVSETHPIMNGMEPYIFDEEPSLAVAMPPQNLDSISFGKQVGNNCTKPSPVFRYVTGGVLGIPFLTPH